MVDLLGQAGKLKEAFNLIKGMKIMANARVWGALPGACRMHKYVDLAKFAVMKLSKIEPDKTSNFLLVQHTC